VQLKNVLKYYGSGTTKVEALRGVSLRLEPGEYLAVVGPSGSGKSTLLAVLGTLEQPDGGEYRINGQNIASLNDLQRARLRAHTFGFVFQAFHLLPERTALQNTLLPMRYGPFPKSNWRRRAHKLLESVGLEGKLDRPAHQLSGGERQRVALARALANDPKVILADEPTGNLDSVTRDEILELFDRLHQQGRTLVVVTHDPEVAARAGHILYMRDGRIAGEA